METAEHIEEKAHDPIAMQFQLVRQVGGGNSLAWTTSVPQDWSLERINEVSDKLMQVASRQEAWARISMLNEEIEVNIKTLAQAKFAGESMIQKYGPRD